MTKLNSTKLVESIIANPSVRHGLGRESLRQFNRIYLPHYLKAATPEFHLDIDACLQDESIKFLEIIAFRGSGKSTKADVSLPLQRALYGFDQFIILLSDTHTQAKLNIQNLINELEGNDLIVSDFGPQWSQDEEWTATNIVLSNGVRIMSRSRGQKIRGLRHGPHRPTLIIADDIENIEAVRTKEQRDKTEEWMLADVIPSLDTNGRIILLGNFLHSDSLVSRIRNRIQKKQMEGVVREYALLDENGESRWPALFTREHIEMLKNKGQKFFLREYQLQTVEIDDQVVRAIGKYSTPPSKKDIRKIAIGVDLAISQKVSADYTAINAAARSSDGKIYNLRTKYSKWNFNQTIENIQKFYLGIRTIYPGVAVEIGVEQVGYQQSAIEELQRRFPTLPVRGIKQTRDKRANLEAMAPSIEREEILIREHGHEDLEIQIVNFGLEAHDDLMDAALISWRMLIQESTSGFTWLS